MFSKCCCSAAFNFPMLVLRLAVTLMYGLFGVWTSKVTDSCKHNQHGNLQSCNAIKGACLRASCKTHKQAGACYPSYSPCKLSCCSWLASLGRLINSVELHGVCDSCTTHACLMPSGRDCCSHKTDVKTGCKSSAYLVLPGSLTACVCRHDGDFVSSIASFSR